MTSNKPLHCDHPTKRTCKKVRSYPITYLELTIKPKGLSDGPCPQITWVFCRSCPNSLDNCRRSTCWTIPCLVWSPGKTARHQVKRFILASGLYATNRNVAAHGADMALQTSGANAPDRCPRCLATYQRHEVMPGSAFKRSAVHFYLMGIRYNGGELSSLS